MNDCKHEFVDIFNIVESLSEAVIDSARSYKTSDSEAQVLNAGKVINKTHVVTYCKNCGMQIGKLPDVKTVIVNKPFGSAISNLDVGDSED